MEDTAALLTDGIAMLRRGRTSKARDLFTQLTKVEPKNPLGLSYLGVSLALADKDFKQAEDLCFRAAMKSMDSAQLHANLAWVYHLQGKRRHAVESVGEALSRDPANSDALRIQSVMGKRQRPPIGGLPRGNPVNKTLGKILHKLKKK